jgi:nucleotide-binding universal stress UspA family protein
MTDDPPPAAVLACVDGSTYTNSVCDYAAWFAGRMDADINLLHVAEGLPLRLHQPPAFLAHCVERLANDGATPSRVQALGGEFAELASATESGLIVMGKRGLSSDTNKRSVGANVEQLVRGSTTPVCFTSKLFLPIRSAVAVLDWKPHHRKAVEFICSHPGLRDLDFDVVVNAPHAVNATPKVQWARSMLSAHDVDVFALDADDAHDALIRYLARRRSDLLLVSREVLLSPPEALLPFGEGDIWSWRTPILIC